ncbi:molecular chaperone Hsp33 [Caldicellulosiruptor bescii]|jgi:molecular chaperone Hsp33|uniref:33 kDa chaperonin n=2 Tax=Caldicellulosiruptor bescii TaxID=31899 RepID=B9MQ78_CALBD|nr:Hsp33 family molecular chaperone HslO [Caldicellulosiruptor bescii]ACM59870.1 Hsp33 protein [Caldicellulosiruptor bescii DSM 6725]PBC87280.1 molecular chaperone Hsp33 [Caldicellulosiruptor bescii]PBC90220.1 molecular chaperone Hsp33 [Caldicellulosiruptor bescii]PBD04352.1 molecular chaperone Hsp33 [Caldicellulosiruptor bescii]PBD06017.1 molecular chaperone Hsp33 [Caldicellulosiruptor bescii]
MAQILRALSKDKNIAIFIMESTDIVEYACKIHNLPPIPAAALGRLLTATSMMGVMLKGENHSVSVQISCSGVLKGLVAVSDSKGNVKGYVKNKEVLTEIDERGKLNVKGAIGEGTLTVIKDLGLKEPYIGQIELVSGEIAEDITHYFAMSEQIPSAVALGVLIDRDESIKSAGGFIIQVLPETDEKVILELEQKLKDFSNISSVLENKSIEEIVKELFGNIEYEVLAKYHPVYKCDCSKEKVESIIPLLKDEEISNEIIEIVCTFCQKKYYFSKEEAFKIKYGE